MVAPVEDRVQALEQRVAELEFLIKTVNDRLSLMVDVVLKPHVTQKNIHVPHYEQF